MLIRLCLGVLVNNSPCGVASLGASRSLSKVLGLVSHRALVTGEWYIPGQKAMGFRSWPLTQARELLSKGLVNVETTGMVPGEEELNSISSFKFWELDLDRLSE